MVFQRVNFTPHEQPCKSYYLQISIIVILFRNNQTFQIVFASDMKRDYTIYPSMIYSQSGIVWFYNDAEKTSIFNGTQPLAVSSSRQRFLSITINKENTQTTIAVQGIVSEIVSIVVYHSTLQSATVNCSITALNGQANLVITPTNVLCS
jgi:hypothetical protein